jgi:hypothetical protein
VVAAQITAQAEEAYDMKVRLVAIVVVCVALASGAWAQVVVGGFTARAAGMGGAAIGVADDAAAWAQNPAGLAALNVTGDSEYASDAMFSYANVDEANWYNITWSGWKPSEAFGAGAGFLDMATDTRVFGVGFGAGFKNMPLSGGFSISNVESPGTRYNGGGISPDQFGAFDGEFTYLTAGLMYRLAQGDDKAPIRFGIIATDVTEQVLPNMIWSAGFSWAPTSRLLIAVDAIDLTDELEEDIMVNGGIEYGFDAGDGRTVYGRAGMTDDGDEHNLTLGLGYRYGVWHADFAWVDGEPESVWSLGLGINL